MRYGTVPDALRKGPFTTQQAAALGVTRHMLQGDSWWQILRGVWVHADNPDSRELRLAAVRLVLGQGSFICGPTASWGYGIDVIHPLAKDVWVGRFPGSRFRKRAGFVVRQVEVGPGDLVEIGGAPITTPLRTAFDCARWLPLVEGVVVADALSHAGRFTEAEFAAYVEGHRGARGIRSADRVAEVMDSRSESPMESRLRMLLILEGLPRPEPQYRVCDVGELVVARADLAYPEYRVIVEYDGAQHFKQRRADDRRRDRMRDLGWNVIVVSAEDYFQMPWAVVASVRNALSDAGFTFTS